MITKLPRGIVLLIALCGLLSRTISPAQAKPVHELMWAFRQPPKLPSAGALVAGPDGYYWGTTEAGGAAAKGTIYKVKPDGSDWRTIVSFTDNGSVNRGAQPRAALVSDGAGNFWGTTQRGGAHGVGTVFKVNATTGQLVTVVEFTRDGSTNRGAEPRGDLVSDGAGFLWGTTSEGGYVDYGTIFKINTATGHMTTVTDFTYNGPSTAGSEPRCGLVNDGAGFLWGTAPYGGTREAGTLFKVNIITGVFTTVVHFDYANGYNPIAGLTNDGNGFLWGTARSTVFKVNIASGALINVANIATGSASGGRLISDGLGNFWGTTTQGGADGLGSIFKMNTTTGVLETAFEYRRIAPFNSYPLAGLVRDGAGSFLGTTSAGGPDESGTVFRFNATTGQYTTILNFSDQRPGASGTLPYAGLISDGAGYFWGTTKDGGLGHGTVFKIHEQTGELTTLARFSDKGTSNRGSKPRAMLVSDDAGYLWGSTSEGGAAGGGTIFKINRDTGIVRTLVELPTAAASDQHYRPNAELVPDGKGFFWGTTLGGYYSAGATSYNSAGTIFKINTTTHAFSTVFANFSPLGANQIYAALTSDGLGNFWGTSNRGSFDDDGTIFKVSQGTGQATTVARFSGYLPNKGTEPRSKLLNDGAGHLWGVTSEGGLPGLVRGLGTLYKVNIQTGALTTVLEFTGIAGFNRGSEPRAGLTIDGTGTFWGTTWTGGAYDSGTIYKVNPATAELVTVLDFTGFGAQANCGGRPGYGSLLLHSDGNLYGTTQEGGPEGGGTIFRLRFGPTPVTFPANPPVAAGATLSGTINPNGQPTTVTFEYGTTPTLVNPTIVSVATTSNGTTPQPFNRTIDGLLPLTTYYFRIVGRNSENPVPQRGRIESFITSATPSPNSPPLVMLLGPANLTIEATGSYTDAGAVAIDAEAGSLVPRVTMNTVVPSQPGQYSVIWGATDGTLSGTATRIVNVVDTIAPVIVPPDDISRGTTDPKGATVTYSAKSITDLVGIMEVSYSHPSGSFFPRGTTTVTMTAKDVSGNQSISTFTVTVSLISPVHDVHGLVGTAVPEAGVDSGIPAGATWTAVGVPAISPTGKVAFVGRWIAPPPAEPGSGLFIDGTLLAKVGDPSPVGATIESFKEPVFSQDSDLLLVCAVLSGADVNDLNDHLLLSFDPSPVVIAREGDATNLEGSPRLAGFRGMTANAGRILFVSRLRGGLPPARTTDNLAVFVAEAGRLDPWVRTGQLLLGRTLATMRIFTPTNVSMGHGRGEWSSRGLQFLARFSDGSQAIVESDAPNEFQQRVGSGDSVLPAGDFPLVWKRFGNAVSRTSDGESFTFLGTVGQPASAPFTGLSWKGIFLGGSESIEEVSALGRSAPAGTVGEFTKFADPIIAADGTYLAFLGSTKFGRATVPGIFTYSKERGLSTVAALDSEPPGASRARWKAFTSLAAPGGGLGPLFTARLEGVGISKANDTGLWIVDTNGVLQCLIRKGGQLQGKTVKSFNVLKAAAGSPGVTRAFNGATEIAWQVRFTDGSTAVVVTTVP